LEEKGPNTIKTIIVFAFLLLSLACTQLFIFLFLNLHLDVVMLDDRIDTLYETV